jgi:hypothetical protein
MANSLYNKSHYHVISICQFVLTFVDVFLQGRFSINLQGTGLELSPEVKWRTAGRSPSQLIYRYPVRSYCL